ncbi:hypothetical protein [Geobacillus sp. FSL W8-1251]|uniref:hypothetical protein n=1 Tax=Geobacillus sp. FSL W8-1251 TaxID=2954650 RepID=UPI0030F6563C
MPTPLKNENTLSDPSNQKMARRFILAIPFYLAVPISFGLFFYHGFSPIQWKACQGRLFFPQNRRFKIPQKDLSLILLFFFLEPLFP